MNLLDETLDRLVMILSLDDFISSPIIAYSHSVICFRFYHK